MRPKFSIKRGADGNVAIHSPDVVDPRVLYKLGMVEMAKIQFAEVAPKVFGFVPNVERKEDLMKMGEVLWKETYQKTQVDDDAGQKLIEWAHEQGSTFMNFFEVEQNQLVYFGVSRWADQAFPTVTMGEKFCAALMATRIPEDMVDEIECPWKAFVIEVPGKMLSVFDAEAMRRTRIVRILVHKTDHATDAWRWVAFGENGQHVWRLGTPDYLLSPVEFGKTVRAYYEDNGDRDAFENDLHRDERLYVLIGRLVLNICLAVADPDMIKPVGSSHKRHATREGRRGPPEQRVFQVGRPISLDCREAIQEYIEGEREAHELKIQSLVRGYYRRQPHGPKLALRRRQWIEPYWRGPEGAPILVRPHTIPEDP